MDSIAIKRAEIEATMCKGDTVHSDMPSWHDWRLWQREAKYEHTKEGYTGFSGFQEVWYCTRCRKIEERLSEKP
jgi:hypothetical protein